MKLHTPLCDLLNIEHPVILAPMANASGGRLAAAVSAAGGLGLIGGGYGVRDWVEREIAEAGNQRVGMGFITWSLALNPDLLDTALAAAPAAVMLSFGDAAPFVDKVKAAGAKLILQVQTVALAREAAELGADVIVAQGTEAGGHGGSRSTFSLVPAVVDAVAPVPVVAAGGVADGRGLAAALMQGAQGVLVGSRFYASRESLAHENAKQGAVAATGDDTFRGSVFDVARGLPWPKPWTIRTVRSPYLDEWAGREEELAALGTEERERFHKAIIQGDMSVAPVLVGEGADLIREVSPAADIVEGMVSEAADLLLEATERYIRV